MGVTVQLAALDPRTVPVALGSLGVAGALLPAALRPSRPTARAVAPHAVMALSMVVTTIAPPRGWWLIGGFLALMTVATRLNLRTTGDDDTQGSRVCVVDLVATALLWLLMPLLMPAHALAASPDAPVAAHAGHAGIGAGDGASFGFIAAALVLVTWCALTLRLWHHPDDRPHGAELTGSLLMIAAMGGMGLVMM